MIKRNSAFKNSAVSKIVFISSLITLGFWILGKTIDVYQIAWLGAIFELFWLLILLILFSLPVISFIFLIKEEFNLRSLFLYSLLISVLTIILLIFIE